MNNKTLAKRVKELRALKGMSQEFLADESQLSLRTIQRIENGESKPTGETVKRLANALDVSLYELVDTESKNEKMDLSAALILFKQLISKSDDTSSQRIFRSFISILTALKSKDLTDDQTEMIEGYLQFLELEKIPSFSNELFKGKLRKFRKFLKAKLGFVPNNLYTLFISNFAIAFGIAFGVTKGISIELVLGVLIGVSIGVLIDLRIRKQGRNLSF